MPIYRKLDSDFFKHWSPEMAYILGFFTADGCMISRRNGGKYIEIYITDESLLRDIRKIIRSNHKILVRDRGDGHRKGYKLQIGSKEMFDDLYRLGITPKKSLNIKFPRVPKKYISDFIRGYFDGDGCVSIGYYWRKDRRKWQWEISSRFISGSRDFLVGLWDVLRNVSGIKGGYIYKKNRGFELVFSRWDSVALFKLMYHNTSDIFLRRKYKIFREGFKKLNLGT